MKIEKKDYESFAKELDTKLVFISRKSLKKCKVFTKEYSIEDISKLFKENPTFKNYYVSQHIHKKHGFMGALAFSRIFKL